MRSAPRAGRLMMAFRNRLGSLLRLTLSFAGLVISGTTALLAADSAERAVQGFSSDGRYFAFEQYGIRDGSGFPYSDLFIIDLERDEWIDGTPIRVLLEDEAKTLGAARDEAMSKARPLLDRLAIGEPGIILASHVVYQATADPRRMVFIPHYRSLGNLEPIGEGDEDAVTLTLEEVVLPSPRDCPVDDTPKVGFLLKLAGGAGKPKEIFRDKAIPASRGCPLAYSLSDVIAFGYEAGGYSRHVALISVFAYGFEGADRRFVAVSFR